LVGNFGECSSSEAGTQLSLSPHNARSSLVSPSPFFFPSLTLIDGNTCWELSLTSFPNTESMKCYGGAMSIFERKAVNVKPVLIYWDEL
jgi:hypothetical protein